MDRGAVTAICRRCEFTAGAREWSFRADRHPSLASLSDILICDDWSSSRLYWPWTFAHCGLYKIFFSLRGFLLHNNIVCKHPLYFAIYCTILPGIIAPSSQVLRCFWGVWRCCCFFRGRILDVSRCFRKKIRSRHEKEALLHIVVQYPPPSPPLLPTILRNIYFPHDPGPIVQR